MPSLLLIDDDVALCALLREFLAAEGFDVEVAHDGASAIERLRRGLPDAVILDVMLPKRSGFDVLGDLRALGAVPVLMLTARGEEVDRIVGLELGADDYVPKPCNPRELVARIRAILRRSGGLARTNAPATIRVEDVELRPRDRVVLCGGRPIELTSAEFGILEALLERAGTVVSKQEASRRALARDHGPFDRAIDVHVSRVRRKLGPRPDGTMRIKTVRGLGYIYTVPTTSPRGDA